MPYVAEEKKLESSNFGGWILAMIDEISKNKNIELAIATVYNCKKIEEYENDGIKYYLIPGKLNYKYYKETEEYWKQLDKIFNADIVHLFGSEFYHGLAYINALPNKKSVLNIQGLVSKCGSEYTAGITSKEIIKNITIRDILKRDNIFQQQKKFIKRGINENKIINQIDYVIGRTFWDYSNVKSINSNVKYFKNNESLRSSFYQNEWDINKINRHSIFVSQGSYPIKGLHILLKALRIVVKSFPETRLYIGGPNITDTVGLKNKLKLSGYGKYLKKIIKNNNIEKNVCFLGNLKEEQMLNQYLKSNLFVLPSVIENSSNSLAEAMILGLPCIASYTGGTPSMLENNVEGILYSYSDYEVLAQHIIELFENDKLCNEYSKNARKRALARHSLKRNMEELYNIYNIIENGGRDE